MDSKRNFIKTISKLSSWVVFATTLLLPLFFLPVAANLFTLPKTILLGFATLLLIIFWMIKNIATNSFRVTLSPFTLPLLLLALVTLVSSFASLNQFVESFISTSSPVIFLFLFFLAATTIKTPRNFGESLLKATMIAAIFLSISAVLESIKVGPSSWLNRLFQVTTDSSVFITPAGSVVALISFLIPTLIISLLAAATRKSVLDKSFYFISAALITAALVVASFNVLPGKPNAPVFLPFETSWQIAVENIKQPKSFLIGVGPSNYIQAFSAHKTVNFNQFEFWNTRFNTASNWPLHLFTTLGLIGLAVWFYLLFTVFKHARTAGRLTGTGRIALVAVGAVLLITFFIPMNFLLLSLMVTMFIVIALEMRDTKHDSLSELLIKLFAVKRIQSKNFNQRDESNYQKSELLPLILGVPVILLALIAFYGGYRVMAADVYFRQSLQAAAENNGTLTYNKQRQAIQTNPYMASYHRAYASTNLALANSISSQEELTDQDRNNITQLIQQSIREGRAAVLIGPNDPANWETLAGIYRNLINVADGALDWATSAYSETIRRDPFNPRLRLELGGIFYQLEQYDTAIRLFEQSAQLKPDWANSHYNLANAYRQANRLQEAIAEYDVVLSLVDPSSSDYTQALTEQNDIRSELGEAEQAGEPQAGELTQPEPLPTPLPDNQTLPLDEAEAAPPTPEETGQRPPQGFSDLTEPSPSPSPSPSPTTSPPPSPTPEA